MGILAIVLSLASAPAPATEPQNLDVCSSCEIRSIKDAVERAAPHATIRVSSGVYAEGEIRIDKPIRLLGIDTGGKPVIDGRRERNVFLVSAPGVEIKGFHIRGSGNSYTEEFAGIKAIKADKCNFSQNKFEGNVYGIYLAETKGCRVNGNTLISHSTSEASSGNGVHGWKSESLSIEDNRISGHRDGIYLEFVHDSKINRNFSEHNLRYGLHFMFSHRNVYRDNAFDRNGSGVAVMYSKEIIMSGNVFSGSLGSAAYGILLKEISMSDIRLNVFRDNTVGAYLEGTTRTVLSANKFEGNGWALRLLGDNDNVSIVQNDFIGNTYDLSTNASRSQNLISGNYWSRYRGIDLDRNGVGDSPYYPVQLSSMLMERYGASVLLIKSFFFTVLDEAESYLPVLTPADYRDDRPRLSPMRLP